VNRACAAWADSCKKPETRGLLNAVDIVSLLIEDSHVHHPMHIAAFKFTLSTLSLIRTLLTSISIAWMTHNWTVSYDAVQAIIHSIVTRWPLIVTSTTGRVGNAACGRRMHASQYRHRHGPCSTEQRNTIYCQVRASRTPVYETTNIGMSIVT
jgi:hypothetical protein